MSSRISSALKGGAEVSPSTAAAHRGSDPGDPATGFAAALGAMVNSHSPSGHHSHDGAATGGGDHSDTPATDDTGSPTGNAPTLSADATDATPVATLPRLAGWFSAGNQAPAGAAPPAGHRAPAKPGAVAAAAAASMVAASLVGAAVQPAAAAPTAAAQPAAAALAAPLVAGSPLAGQPVLAATQLTQPGFAAPLPATTGALAGHPHATIGASPNAHAADPTASTQTGDPTAPSVPGIAVDTSPHTPAQAAADPSAPAIGADLAAPALTQAAPSPAATIHLDAASLAAAAPAVAAMANTVAPSAGGSATRDFADTARDGQAAAAAAFSGVAASTGTAGGVGAPSVGAANAAAPSFGTDPGAANVATQVSGQVLRMLANSGNEAVVRLHPPDLGEVTVRVAVSGRDVSAWFGSSQPAVQQTISQGLGQLQTDLGNAGYSLNNAWVGADASGFGARGDSAPPQPAASIAPVRATPLAPAAATLSSNSGVSIYV